MMQIARLQGFSWGGRSGQDWAIWLDGDTLYTDANFVVKGTSPWVDVRAYGAVGDGVTDDTAALAAAIAAAAAAGSVVLLPPGTFLTGTLAPTAGLVLRGAGRDLTTLKLKANASGALINTTAYLDIEGVTLDGNNADQSTRRDTVVFDGATGSFYLHRCRFRNGGATCVYATNVDHALSLTDCEVLNQSEATGAAHPTTSQAVLVNSGTGRVEVLDCQFINTAPSDNSKMPNGLTIQGDASATPLMSLRVEGCHFAFFGNETNSNGCIEAYNYLARVVITGNTFYKAGYAAITVANSAEVAISSNVVTDNNHTFAAPAIAYAGFVSPHPGTIAQAYHNASIVGNVVARWACGYAYDVSGAAGTPTHRIVVANNVAHASKAGIRLFGVENVELNGNVIEGTTGSGSANFGGINLYNCTGTVAIRGGRIGNCGERGIVGQTGMSAAHLVIQGVIFDTNTTDQVYLDTVASLVMTNCRFLSNVRPLVAGTVTLVVLTDNVWPTTATAVSVTATTYVHAGNTFDTLDGTGSATINALADGAGVAATAATVTGAAVGDFVEVATEFDTQGIMVYGYVSSANTVSVRFQNETGSVRTIDSGNPFDVYVRVRKR